MNAKRNVRLKIIISVVVILLGGVYTLMLSSGNGIGLDKVALPFQAMGVTSLVIFGFYIILKQVK